MTEPETRQKTVLNERLHSRLENETRFQRFVSVYAVMLAAALAVLMLLTMITGTNVLPVFLYCVVTTGITSAAEVYAND